MNPIFSVAAWNRRGFLTSVGNSWKKCYRIVHIVVVLETSAPQKPAMLPSSALPISRIKVRIPFRRRELITRTRLIEALYDQLERRLLLLVAPAGYGKTSLLVDFAQQSELPVCWLSLDALDQEPQRFLRYMIAAIAERFPRFGQDSLAALESMVS